MDELDVNVRQTKKGLVVVIASIVIVLIAVAVIMYVSLDKRNRDLENQVRAQEQELIQKRLEVEVMEAYFDYLTETTGYDHDDYLTNDFVVWLAKNEPDLLIRFLTWAQENEVTPDE